MRRWACVSDPPSSGRGCVQEGRAGERGGRGGHGQRTAPPPLATNARHQSAETPRPPGVHGAAQTQNTTPKHPRNPNHTPRPRHRHQTTRLKPTHTRSSHHKLIQTVAYAIKYFRK